MTTLYRETNACFRLPCGPRRDAHNVKEQEPTPLPTPFPLASRRPISRTATASCPSCRNVAAREGGSWASTTSFTQPATRRGWLGRPRIAGTPGYPPAPDRGSPQEFAPGWLPPQHFQHILDPDPHSADARAASALLGIECDAVKKAHAVTLIANRSVFQLSLGVVPPPFEVQAVTMVLSLSHTPRGHIGRARIGRSGVWRRTHWYLSGISIGR